MTGSHVSNEEKQKIEIKRLEHVLPQFMAEYKELCKKYRCQIVGVPVILSPQLVQITAQIDSYNPELDKADEEAKKKIRNS